MTHGSQTQTRAARGARLTYQRAVEEQRHPEQGADAEGQDEGPPPAPAQGAAVAGRADQRGEHEAQDGTEEPRQAVVLLGKTCAQGDTVEIRTRVSKSGKRLFYDVTVRFTYCPQGGARRTTIVKNINTSYFLLLLGIYSQ